MMDHMKVELNVPVRPWAVPQEDTNAGGNLLNGMKLEFEDPTYDLVFAVKSETPPIYSAVKSETSPIPISFPTIKCEPKDEFTDVDIVEEELLDVTAEDNDSTNRPVKQHCRYDMRIREGAKRNISAQHIGPADYVQPMDNSSGNEQLQFFGNSFIPTGDLKNPESNDIQFKSLLCNYCGKSFIGKEAFLKHTLTHKEDKLYMCEMCGRNFEEKRFLASHMLSHSADKPFKCDTCEMACKTRSNLMRHKLTHTGDKANKSQICEKLSSQKHNLVATEGPYRCVICNTGFKEKQKLRVHTLMHLRTSFKRRHNFLRQKVS
ncbi:zinc finger protein 860-like isoform X2 [Periplaneta americana]|uniref:zinc finger protein 860-like isoform X2 n=1 Tax=Periplaneta americana TaxID=6978 RepID=UPI0037E793B9